MKRICIAALGAALLTGCQTMSQNETAGALLGGVAGAVLGNQFGSGDGRVAMTAIGAVIGATVGAQIAESLDAASQQQANVATQQALNTAPVGGTVTWDNPANTTGPASGSTVITRAGVNDAGRTCREFRQTITVGGQQETGVGVACLAGDGNWDLM